MFKLQKDYPDYEYKSLRLPTKLIKQVQTLADANNLSFNKVVIQCIEYALDNMESKLKVVVAFVSIKFQFHVISSWELSNAFSSIL